MQDQHVNSSPGGVPRAQERLHQEIRLSGAVGVLRADRAGAARPAAEAHAIPAGRAFHMGHAGRDIVAGARERAHRTGFQAPAPGAGFTWARERRRRWNGELFAKTERAAVGMPEPVARMDEDSDRRGMDRLGPARPLLERPERRAAEGEEGRAAEFARQRLDHPPAPAVERIAQAVASLGRSGERAPALAPSHAGKDDRADAGERALLLAVFEPERAARNEAGSPDGANEFCDYSSVSFGAI